MTTAREARVAVAMEMAVVVRVVVVRVAVVRETVEKAALKDALDMVAAS